MLFVGLTIAYLEESRRHAESYARDIELAELREFKERFRWLGEVHNREILTTLTEIIENGLDRLIRSVPNARACVMLVDRGSNPPMLRVRFHRGMVGAPDLDVAWENREGWWGQAWQTRHWITADLSRETDGSLRDEWLMAPDKIALTRGLESAIVAPLFDYPKAESVVGALGCDCAQAPQLSRMHTDAFIERMENEVEMISRLVPLVEVFEESENRGS